MKYPTTVLMLLAGLALVPGLRAQYRWHITRTNQVGEVKYDHPAIDCNGMICAAIERRYDPTTQTQDIYFLRSADGGDTWNIQYPEEVIPASYNMLAIQQIDSINAVAVGDSGLVVRTINGGKTWIRQNLPIKLTPYDLHFSDSLTGIIVTQSNYDDTSVPNVFFTTNAGATWNGIRLPVSHQQPTEPRSGHSDGHGTFRVSTLWAGPVYTTHDYWQTVDTTFIYDFARNEDHVIAKCAFKGDTLVAYGSRLVTNSLHAPLMTRSTDGGKTWKEVDLPDTDQKLYFVSGLDRDVVFAGAFSAYPHSRIFRSTDHGTTWLNDSIYSDTTALPVTSASVSDDGYAVALFGLSSKELARGEPMKAKVSNEVDERVTVVAYPTPSTNAVTVNFSDARGTTKILDILGREVKRVVAANSGPLTVDVSTLPSGVYYLVNGHERARIVKQ